MEITVKNLNRAFCKNNVIVNCFFSIVIKEIFISIRAYAIANLEYDWGGRWFGSWATLTEYMVYFDTFKYLTHQTSFS